MSDEEEKKPFNKFLLYLLICFMVITGSANTILNKILQKLEGCGVPFEGHHWIITFGMFCGELVSIFFYAYIVFQRKKMQNLINKEQEQEGDIKKEPLQEGQEIQEGDEGKEKKKPPVPTNLIFAISAGSDLIASTLNTFALTYLTSSMYQMMRGLELFFVFLWSKIFLKNPLYRHALLGVGSLIFGLTLVGINSILNDDKEVAKDPGIGIILLCASQLFSSTVYIIQEKFFIKYEVHPLQLVGFEGLWGFTIYTVLLIIFQFSPCDNWSNSLKKGVCFEYKENKFHIEDTKFAFKQMGDKISILLVFIFYIVSIALYNIVGVSLTKLVSSTARAVVDTVRTVFIWLFFLFIHPVKGTEEHFHILQFIGFIFLVTGTLIYNEIIVIPYWGLDYYTRDNIAKRKEEENKLGKIGIDEDEEKKLSESKDANDTKENTPKNENEKNDDNKNVTEKKDDIDKNLTEKNDDINRNEAEKNDDIDKVEIKENTDMEENKSEIEKNDEKKDSIDKNENI